MALEFSEAEIEVFVPELAPSLEPDSLQGVRSNNRITRIILFGSIYAMLLTKLDEMMCFQPAYVNILQNIFCY